jgi:hypothetical protein
MSVGLVTRKTQGMTGDIPGPASPATFRHVPEQMSLPFAIPASHEGYGARGMGAGFQAVNPG